MFRKANSMPHFFSFKNKWGMLTRLTQAPLNETISSVTIKSTKKKNNNNNNTPMSKYMYEYEGRAKHSVTNRLPLIIPGIF